MFENEVNVSSERETPNVIIMLPIRKRRVDINIYI